MNDPSVYTVVFDLSAQPYVPPWFSLLAGAGLALAAAGAAAKAQRRGLKILGALAFCGALAFTLSMLWLHWSEDQSLRRGIAEASVNIAEGRVENFKPDSAGGNVPQTFTVAGVGFSISAATSSPAFRQTMSRGGPNLAERCVRIGYVTDNAFTPPRHEIVWLGVRPSGECPA